MGRSNQLKLKRRVQEVMQLILAGAEYHDVRQYAAEHDWGVSERQTRRYIAAAYRRIAEVMDREREEIFARHLMQRRALYARCLKANDLRAALGVLRDEAELHGLYPATKIAPTTPDGNDPYQPVAGLADLIPELRAALERCGQGPGAAPPASAEPGGCGGIDPSGSDADHDLGGSAAGSVAGTSAAIPFDVEPAAVLPPKRQEHGHGGAGAARRSP
jgi:hypothetical protein